MEIVNFSNSSNHICSPGFHVPTIARVIKTNSFEMKKALLRMCGLNVICVRGMTGQMPVEVGNETNGLIMNQ